MSKQQRKAQKQKTRTASEGGSAVLRSAREQSGSGLHGMRKPHRGTERRRSIDYHS